MSFNVTLQKACRRASRMRDYMGEVVTSMLEPFVLKSLYPLVDYVRKDGTVGRRHEIMPHQQKMHSGIAPSGKRAKFICYCVAGETVIGGRTIQEWVERGEAPGRISTLFGEAETEVPYLRGRADLYRVETQSGRSVTVTLSHRFLSEYGWRELDALSEGSLIAIGDTKHEGSGSEKSIGLKDGYLGDFRRHGVSLPPSVVAGLGRWQQLRKTDAGSSAWVACSRLSIGDCAHLSQEDRRLVYELFLFALTCDGLPLGQRYTSEQAELWTSLLNTLALLCPLVTCEWGVRPPGTLDRSDALAWSLQHSSIPRDVSRQLALTRILGMQPLLAPGEPCDSCSLFRACSHWHEILRRLSLCLCQAPLPPLAGCRVFYTLQEWCRSLSSCLDYTSRWDKITNITFVRHDDFYDIGVPGAEHYEAEGVWHHNSGGAGVGKTLALCAQMLWFLKTYPGIKIVVTTAYDYYFPEIILPKWREVLDEDDPFIASQNIKERSYRMINGSEIRFHAYDDPEKVKGWEAHIIWIEEAAEVCNGNNYLAFSLWQMFITRLRAKPNHYPRMIYVSQNPKGHNWVWKIFIKPEPAAPQTLGDIGLITVYGQDSKGNNLLYREWEKTDAAGNTFYTIACPSYSNVHLAAGYVATMMSQHEGDKGKTDRMIEGLWSPINSLVYEPPFYAEATHCIPYQTFLDRWEYDEIPNWLRVVVGIDCGGARSPWAVEYYLQAEDNTWVCFDEIYLVQGGWDDIAQKIKEKHKQYGFTNIAYWIDPQSSNMTSGPRSEMIKTEFAARGIPTDFPRGYNKRGAIERVRSFLQRDRTEPCPYLDDEESEDEAGEPQWMIGKSRLYYLKDVPGKPKQHNLGDGKTVVLNPEGHAAPGNIHEKTVYRYDETKNREAKEAEEGLSPKKSEKLMDRDDHAQTAEFFAFLGIAPLTKEERHRKPPKAQYATPPQYGKRQRRV